MGEPPEDTLEAFALLAARLAVILSGPVNGGRFASAHPECDIVELSTGPKATADTSAGRSQNISPRDRLDGNEEVKEASVNRGG